MRATQLTLEEREKQKREEWEGPLFVIVYGVLRYCMSGIWKDVPPDGIAFRNHGAFLLEYAGQSYGIVQHTTPHHIRRRVVMIPSNKTVFISNGEFRFVKKDYALFVNPNVCPRCLTAGTEKFKCNGYGPPGVNMVDRRHEPFIFCTECGRDVLGLALECPSCRRPAEDCEASGQIQTPQPQEA